MAADLNKLRIKDDYLRRVLEGEEFLLFDGAFGTMMQRAGLTLDGENPDLLNLTNPQAITAIHREYVEAGAQVATTNTFGANARKLDGAASVAEVYQAAAQAARASGARYVAGDIGPTGALLEPLGTLSFEEAYGLFAEQAQAAQAAGCDLIVVETMSDLLEAKAAVLAACENTNLPVFATMTFGEDGRTFLGTTPAVAAATLSSLGVAAVGMNCSLGPDELAPLVEQMASFARCPLMVQPNAGLPRVVDGKTTYDMGPDDFVRALGRILDAGASIVGGCCGTDPAFIAALAAEVARRCTPAPRAYKPALVVTSAQEAAVLPQGERCVAVIGERINPTGKKRLREALRAGDFDYLVGEAVAQRQAAADILDVNVGLPELDEPAALRKAVGTLQATVSTPLQIDSSDPAAIEAAVRSYAGKPLVNSVNGKAESLEAVLPLVRRYGCAVVGLTLDEDGIPSTAEGRLAIAQRIVEAAEAQGIPRCDIAIDCLVMAAATNQAEVAEVLRAVTLCKERLGVRTVLGVSNVSFGMPQRPLMNATFLATAFGAGLDMPILDPLNERYRDAVAVFRVLNGQDVGAAHYCSAYAPASCDFDAVRGSSVQKLRSPRFAPPDAFSGSVISALADSDDGRVGPSPAGVASTKRVPHEPKRPVDVSCEPGLSERLEASPGGPGGVSADTASAADSPIPITEEFAGDAALVAEIAAYALAGRAAPMGEATKRLLAGHKPLTLVNEVFIPILDEVGRRYDAGVFFLPQLMASAEAVKAGFEVVRKVQDAESAASAASGGSDAIPQDDVIVLATVEGDVHDIGKNIVRMLLENYGFRVVDLGRDVKPQEIVDAALAHNARLVGLSALMTTTVRAMERTITLLHEQIPGCSVMVGGAVLTADYAAEIGADLYAKDAAEGARAAMAYFGR